MGCLTSVVAQKRRAGSTERSGGRALPQGRQQCLLGRMYLARACQGQGCRIRLANSPNFCGGRFSQSTGHCVQGALRASLAIGVPPTLDSATTHKGLAAISNIGIGPWRLDEVLSIRFVLARP